MATNPYINDIINFKVGDPSFYYRQAKKHGRLFWITKYNPRKRCFVDVII